MPRTDFDTANRVADPTRFPRLKLEKDEKKRIVVIERNPFYEFVHRLEMPQIDEHGRAVMTTKTRQDKSTYEVNAMDFVSQPLCLGELEVLKEKGVDPEHCPACAVAKSSDEVKPPTRRYASHVLVYGTKPNTFEVSEPFTVQCIIWLYSERRYNTLIDIAAEEDGKINATDLCLGPCVNKEYQNFEIRPGKAEWRKSEDRIAMAKAALEGNRLTDEQVAEMLGRRVERSWIEEDLKKIHLRWTRLHEGPAVEVTPVEREAESASLEEGLAGLLDDDASTTPDSVADLESVMTDAKAEPEREEKKGETVDFSDFSDLLGDDK